MKTIANVLALAALAAAAPSSAPQDPVVEVKLEMQGNSNVKAVVTNAGSEDVKIFKYSGLLGHGPVQKVQVSSEGELDDLHLHHTSLATCTLTRCYRPGIAVQGRIRGTQPRQSQRRRF